MKCLRGQSPVYVHIHVCNLICIRNWIADLAIVPVALLHASLIVTQYFSSFGHTIWGKNTSYSLNWFLNCCCRSRWIKPPISAKWTRPRTCVRWCTLVQSQRSYLRTHMHVHVWKMLARQHRSWPYPIKSAPSRHMLARPLRNSSISSSAQLPSCEENTPSYNRTLLRNFNRT
jgi:hypothetical protein